MASCGPVQIAISVLGRTLPNQASVLQGVVTSVGFIGAGAIRQIDITTGNATAASVWAVGIMGAAVGYGYYDIGIILAAADLMVLLIPTAFRAGPSAPDSPRDRSGAQSQRVAAAVGGNLDLAAIGQAMGIGVHLPNPERGEEHFGRSAGVARDESPHHPARASLALPVPRASVKSPITALMENQWRATGIFWKIRMCVFRASHALTY